MRPSGTRTSTGTSGAATSNDVITAVSLMGPAQRRHFTFRPQIQLLSKEVEGIIAEHEFFVFSRQVFELTCLKIGINLSDVQAPTTATTDLKADNGNPAVAAANKAIVEAARVATNIARGLIRFNGATPAEEMIRVIPEHLQARFLTEYFRQFKKFKSPKK